jgi:hypothetical protein
MAFLSMNEGRVGALLSIVKRRRAEKTIRIFELRDESAPSKVWSEIDFLA